LVGLRFNAKSLSGWLHHLHKRANQLFRDLVVAHGDGRLLAKLARIDILALDDFAMAPLKDSERRDFLELCDDRYQHRSMI
jgi:DNA replication protein DnaC